MKLDAAPCGNSNPRESFRGDLFSWSRRTIFSKIKVLFGGVDVNFPDSPGFSDKYILRGQDEAALRAIFSPALRQALEPLHHLTIEGADDALFIFRAGRRIEPDELVARIEENKRILALFFEAQQANAA